MTPSAPSEPFYDPATIVDRLRGIYRIPIRDGLGPVATSEEPNNPDFYVRTFPDCPAIQLEAARVIEALRADLAACRDGRTRTLPSA